MTIKELDLDSLSNDEFFAFINCILDYYFVQWGTQYSLSRNDNSYSRLLSRVEYLEDGINSVIFSLEHNPRTGAETRDKYVISKLKDLLKERI